nr:hypothetical protein [Pyrobaculum sp.]
MKYEGMVMHRETEFFEGQIQFRLVREIQVEHAAALTAMEVVVGGSVGVEAICGGKGQGSHQALISKRAQGSIYAGQADLLAFIP